MNEELIERIETDEEKTSGEGCAKRTFLKICPLPSLILFALAVIAAVIHIACALSVSFSDAMNVGISRAVRLVLAKLTGALPFSLAETVLLLLPLIFICMLIYSVAISKDDTSERRTRYFCTVFSVLSLFYTLFVFGMVPGYNGSTVESKLGLDRRDVTADQLYETAIMLRESMEAELDGITFISGDSSVMPYSLTQLSDRLCLAYEGLSERHGFIQQMNTRIKPLAISDAMTYTHIAGVYTYYTGEANLNTSFPDYTLPFTVAHELSHQRGIAREDEANFIAFLVCSESDDPYIRYSGYLNLFEYVSSALYKADPAAYRTVISGLDSRVRAELSSYNSFFEKYDDSVVSKISGTVNDTYLKIQGQKDGAASYGRVVDLAVAYFEAEK